MPKPDKIDLCFGYLGLFSSHIWGIEKADHWGGCVGGNGNFMEDRYKMIIHAARSTGYNMERMFPYETKFRTKQSQMLTPFVWIPERDAYDLRQYNQKWFDAFEFVLQTNIANGIVTNFCLTDGCGNHTGPGLKRVRAFNPAINNIQGINLFNYSGSLPLTKEWFTYFIERYRSLIQSRWMVLEVMNEFNLEGNSPDTSARWLAGAAAHILRLGVEPENLCWGAVPAYTFNQETGLFEIDRDKDLTTVASRYLSQMVNPKTGKIYDDKDDRAMDRILVSVHRLGIPGEKVWGTTWPFGERAAFGVQQFNNERMRVMSGSTDGVQNGASPLDREPDGKWPRPDKPQTKAVMKFILSRCGKKRLILETLPSNNFPAAWRPGGEGMIEAYEERYTMKPVNRGAPDPVYPEPPQPEPPTPPTPPPAPPDLPSEPTRVDPWWSWARIRNVRRWTWQAWAAAIGLAFLALRILV